MPAGDKYRVLAADIQARARKEPDRRTRAEFEYLSLAYLRLADQADRNAQSDIVYETPTVREQAQVQQQQQPQPDKDK
jgi:hypothetical protein